MSSANTIRKYLSILVIITITIGCSHLNEFGRRRIKFHFERIKPNKNDQAYTIIDTSVIYKKVSVKNTFDSNSDAEFNRLNSLDAIYLKFYKDGRVGEFRNVELDKIETLNPKKAESNLYNYKNDKFIIQTYFKNAQCGECFVKGVLERISEDSIQIVSGDYIEKYKVIGLPKEFLIYKPDW